MTAAAPVRASYEGAVARITLTRSEKRNALAPATIRELRSALQTAGGDEGVRVVLLAAEGPDFCAGADLEALNALLDAPPDAHRADARAFAELFLTMRTLPKPIVAAVQGRALAGGAGLVSACDIVYAAEDAAFGYPEVKIGFVAAVVMALLRNSVGEKAALELLLTGRQIPAAEAARIGLITRVVPAAQLQDAARSAAEEIAQLPEPAVARTKALFREMAGLPLGEAFDRAVEANVAARSAAEFRDGLRRFLSRQAGRSR